MSAVEIAVRHGSAVAGVKAFVVLEAGSVADVLRFAALMAPIYPRVGLLISAPRGSTCSTVPSCPSLNHDCGNLRLFTASDVLDECASRVLPAHPGLVPLVFSHQLS
jgi:hypothetical protein